jgi:hypothetical protein
LCSVGTALEEGWPGARYSRMLCSWTARAASPWREHRSSWRTAGSRRSVVAGSLRVPIQRTYRLEELGQAMADFAAGTRGKLAVSVS